MLDLKNIDIAHYSLIASNTKNINIKKAMRERDDIYKKAVGTKSGVAK